MPQFNTIRSLSVDEVEFVNGGQAGTGSDKPKVLPDDPLSVAAGAAMAAAAGAANGAARAAATAAGMSAGAAGAIGGTAGFAAGTAVYVAGSTVYNGIVGAANNFGGVPYAYDYVMNGGGLKGAMAAYYGT